MLGMNESLRWRRHAQLKQMIEEYGIDIQVWRKGTSSWYFAGITKALIEIDRLKGTTDPLWVETQAYTGKFVVMLDDILSLWDGDAVGGDFREAYDNFLFNEGDRKSTVTAFALRESINLKPNDGIYKGKYLTMYEYNIDPTQTFVIGRGEWSTTQKGYV